METSEHSQLMMSDSDVILEESVVECEILKSSLLLSGDEDKETDSLNNDLSLKSGSLVEIMFEDDIIGSNEEVQEDLYTDVPFITIKNNDTQNLQHKPKSPAKPLKKLKKRSPKKGAVRTKPLNILPRPTPTPDVANQNKTKRLLGDDKDRMLVRTAEERKIRMSNLMPMPALKRLSLSLQDKVAIIKELENGEKQAHICKRKRLPKSTVQSIWKNREKIQGSIAKVGQTRKRCRRARHEDIEEKLVEWIDSLKVQNVPVNGPQLRAKAQVLAKCMGLLDFRCSTGWLDKFKTRHNLVFKKCVKSPKNGAAGDRKTALDWVTKLWFGYCEGFSSEDIFNADELGLFYKALPEETAKLKSETCHGGKMAKERLTILFCTNSNGSEKLKPLVVGCKRHPQSFNWISNLANLPVEYFSNKKSWITREIFVSWLKRWDKKLRESKRNILLILDNSPAHVINVTLTNIKLACLPPIVASILQPLEHGVSKFFKLRYRRLFLDRLIRKYEQRDSNSQTITLLESIAMLDAAWQEVSPRLITNCFKNANLQSLSVMATTPLCTTVTNNFDDYKDDPLLIEQAVRSGINVPDNVSLYNFSMIDSSLHVTDYSTTTVKDNNDISSLNKAKEELSEDEDSEEDSLQNLVLPSRREIHNFIDVIRSWAMISNENCDYSVHTALGILESFASQQTNSLASLPISTNATNLLGTNNAIANLNVNIVNGIPISIQSNSPAGSANNRNNFNGSQTVFYTPNLGTTHLNSSEMAGSVVTLTIDPPPQRSLTHAHIGNAIATTQGQAHANNSNSNNQQNIHVQQQQQQFFAYLG